MFFSRRSRRREAQCTPCALLARPLVCTVHACTHAPEKIPRVRACVFVCVFHLPSVLAAYQYNAHRSSSFNRSTFPMYIYIYICVCVWRVYDTWCASMLTSVIWRETPRQPTSHASFFLFSPHSPLL